VARKNAHAVAMGKRGGRVTSARKSTTSAQNGAFGGRPPLGLSREEWLAFVQKCGARDPRQVARELLLAFRRH
jgi:hypothetical protein